MDNFEDWCESKGYSINSGVQAYVIGAWANDYAADLVIHLLVDVERGIRRKLKITKRWETENCTDGVFNVKAPLLEPRLELAQDKIKELELEIALLRKHNKRQENRITELEAKNDQLESIMGSDVYLSSGFGDK